MVGAFSELKKGCEDVVGGFGESKMGCGVVVGVFDELKKGREDGVGGAPCHFGIKQREATPFWRHLSVIFGPRVGYST